MNREQRRAEGKVRKPNTQRVSRQRIVDRPARKRRFAVYTASFVAILSLLFAWNANATSKAASGRKELSTAPPTFTSLAVPSSSAASGSGVKLSLDNTVGNVASVDANHSNVGLPTVVSMKRTGAPATPSSLATATTPQRVLEADIRLDLAASNGGRTFDLDRVAPVSQTVLRADGTLTTAGNLKAGERIYLSGNNVGRVVQVTKEWHTPVVSKPDANGVVANRVIATTKRMTDTILYLSTSAEQVKTTPEHPFAVKGKGFVEAGHLKPGDVLVTQDGAPVTVKRVEVRHEPQFVYNLEVENTHDFFVGNSKLLVHNGGECVPAFSMFTVPMEKMTQAGFRSGVAGFTGASRGYLVYVVRDLGTGELLKVGQTGRGLLRFQPYRTRALAEGRQIAVDAFEVDKATAKGMKPYTLESQMQETLFRQGHALPWDMSNIVQNLRAE